MKEQMIRFRESQGTIGNAEADIDDILCILLEFDDALIEAATYSQLSEFVKKTLVPYTQKWYRRTFKIAELSGRTRRTLSLAINQTEALLEVFNKTVLSTNQKTDRRIVELNDFLAHDKSGKVRIERQNVEDFAWLKYVIVAEVFVVVLFYVLQAVPSVRVTLIQ
jgi:hypothetical protein